MAPPRRPTLFSNTQLSTVTVLPFASEMPVTAIAEPSASVRRFRNVSPLNVISAAAETLKTLSDRPSKTT